MYPSSPVDVFNKFTAHIPAWISYTLAQHGFDWESDLAPPRPDRRMLAC